MIIRSKADGHQESQSPEQWKRIKDMGFASKWEIVSNEEAPPRKVIPKEIVSFQQLIKPKTKKDGSKGKPVVSGDKAV
jgi:hypothetical protein